MAANGYDDSPPRNGVILFYSVLTVVLLFSMSILLKSYFAKIMDAEVHEKVLTRGLDKAYEARAKEVETLEKSGISNAMRAYAQRGRTASAVIASESGAGKQGVTGWSQLKREGAATPPPAAPAAEPTKAQNAAPQPANPNAAEATPTPAAGTPSPGRSPIAPATRSAPTAGSPAAPVPNGAPGSNNAPAPSNQPPSTPGASN
jgi:hypothetical protein